MKTFEVKPMNVVYSNLVPISYYASFLTFGSVNVAINVIDLFLKAVVMNFVDPNTVKNNFYLSYLKNEKSYLRCLAMILPGLVLPGYTMLAMVAYDIYQHIQGQRLFQQGTEAQGANKEKAYQLAAAYGNTNAKLYLAEMYLTGKDMLSIQEEKAAALYQSVYMWSPIAITQSRQNSAKPCLKSGLLAVAAIYMKGRKRIGQDINDKAGVQPDHARANLFLNMYNQLKYDLPDNLEDEVVEKKTAFSGAGRRIDTN